MMETVMSPEKHMQEIAQRHRAGIYCMHCGHSLIETGIVANGTVHAWKTYDLKLWEPYNPEEMIEAARSDEDYTTFETRYSACAACGGQLSAVQDAWFKELRGEA